MRVAAQQPKLSAWYSPLLKASRVKPRLMTCYQPIPAVLQAATCVLVFLWHSVGAAVQSQNYHSLSQLQQGRLLMSQLCTVQLYVIEKHVCAQG